MILTRPRLLLSNLEDSGMILEDIVPAFLFAEERLICMIKQITEDLADLQMKGRYLFILCKS